MRKFLTLSISLLALSSVNTFARDDAQHHSIADAMASAPFQEKLDPSIRFFWGKQAYPKPVSIKGEFVSNKKTNGVGKSDTQACEWAMLSALLTFQDRVRQEGGNAVVDIVSYYKKATFSSETQFECHSGNIMSGVALKGRVVKLP